MSVATFGELLVSGRDQLDAVARLPDSALHSHCNVGSDGQREPRSGWSAVVISAPVSSALTAEVARWSRQLAVLTSRLSLACEADRTRPAPTGHQLAEASGWFLTASTALT